MGVVIGLQWLGTVGGRGGGGGEGGGGGVKHVFNGGIFFIGKIRGLLFYHYPLCDIHQEIYLYFGPTYLRKKKK